MAEVLTRHLNKVSLSGYLDNSADPFDLVLILGILILGINLALTLTHSVQELRGQLWRYFGAIAGLRIPDSVGFVVFFVVLTAGLWFLGFIGITGYCPFCGSTWVPMAAIGTLIGARLSDRVYSHVRLDRQGYRPNPGLASTPYYLAEAAVLTVLFLPGLWSDSMAAVAAALGFVAGWLVFFSILPFLRHLCACRLFRSWCREPWQAGKPVPSWVEEYK